MVFLYALRVSGFHCCRANACTICSVVTSLGPDGMSSVDRWTILYRRLLIVCADRPAALRVSVHPSMLLRHGTGALILFLMIHHEHPDLHAAKLSLDKLGSPMDLNLGPLVSPEVQGSNPCPATNENLGIMRFLGFCFLLSCIQAQMWTNSGQTIIYLCSSSHYPHATFHTAFALPL